MRRRQGDNVLIADFQSHHHHHRPFYGYDRHHHGVLSTIFITFILRVVIELDVEVRRKINNINNNNNNVMLMMDRPTRISNFNTTTIQQNEANKPLVEKQDYEEEEFDLNNFLTP
jgi:hypothetical protein